MKKTLFPLFMLVLASCSNDQETPTTQANTLTPNEQSQPTSNLTGKTVTYKRALYPGAVLQLDDELRSPNNQFFFKASYHSSNGGVMQIIKTFSGKGQLLEWENITKNRFTFLKMQDDGNLVAYDSNNRAVWATGTDRNPGAYLTMQDDGNLVIYKYGIPLWSSKYGVDRSTKSVTLLANEQIDVNNRLSSPDKKHYLRILDNTLQIITGGDKGGSLLSWEKRAKGIIKVLKMQTDGNLVAYDSNNKAVWATNTNGNPGAYLTMQNDQNLVLYSKNGRTLWTSQSDNGNSGPTYY